MCIDDAVRMIKPEPDSQFRLVNCDCGSDQVAYLQLRIRGQLVWVVRCMDCGKQTTPDTMVRHTAQTRWNRNNLNERSETVDKKLKGSNRHETKSS
jgi:ribosomal protein S27E